MNTHASPAVDAPASSAIALYARSTPGFDARLRETVVTLLKAAATGPVAQASSLGAEDMVITHLINTYALPIGIFVLDTGLLHAETLALLEQLRAQQAARPHAPLTVYHPEPDAVRRFVAREGEDAMYRSVELRKACCGIRKLEPLGRALAGKKAWVTGLRREQSGARAHVPLVDRSEQPTRDLLKYNPLANWSWADVWHYIASNDVPYNPLHDQFYPSIGCAPCTRAIAVGEDFRAGRWWWESEEAKECGLHVKPRSGAADAAPAVSRSEAAASEASAQAHVAAGDVKAAPAAGHSQSEQAKECGLHVKPHSAATAAAASHSDAADVFASAQAHVAAGDMKAAPAAGRSQSEQAKECGLHVKPRSGAADAAPAVSRSEAAASEASAQPHVAASSAMADGGSAKDQATPAARAAPSTFTPSPSGRRSNSHLEPQALT